MFPSPVWTLEVDWNDDGTYDAVNEAVNLVGLRVRRGRDFFIKAEGKGFERFAVGTATLTLKNLEGRYSALNAASPLYPNVKPGHYARIQVHDGTTLRNVLAGRIADIRPTGDVLNPRVQMVLEDGWTWLKERTASIAVQQTIGTAAAIGLVLDDAEWPTIWGRDLIGSADTIRYWWADQRQADEEIQDLAESELGLFTIAADGKARFRGRHSMDDLVLTVHQVDLEREVGLPQPWEVLRGTVKIFVHPRVREAAGEIWRLQDEVFIPAGESFTLFAPFSYNNVDVPALGVLAPRPYTDYLVNASPGGGGGDLTLSPTIRTSAADNGWLGIAWSPELGLFAAVANSGVGNRVMTSPDGINWTIRTSAADNDWHSIAWSPELGLFAAVAFTGVGNRVMTSPDFFVAPTVFGKTVKLAIANRGNAGGYTGSPTSFLRIRGDALTATNPTILEATAAADVRSVFEHDLPWQQNTNTGWDLVNLMAMLLSGSQLYPMVSLVGKPQLQFAVDLLDRIRLVLPDYGIDDEFRLGMVEHEWLDPAGMVVRTTWRSELAVILDSYWMFPTQIGLTSVFGV